MNPSTHLCPFLHINVRGRFYTERPKIASLFYKHFSTKLQDENLYRPEIFQEIDLTVFSKNSALHVCFFYPSKYSVDFILRHQRLHLYSINTLTKLQDENLHRSEIFQEIDLTVFSKNPALHFCFFYPSKYSVDFILFILYQELYLHFINTFQRSYRTGISNIDNFWERDFINFDMNPAFRITFLVLLCIKVQGRFYSVTPKITPLIYKHFSSKLQDREPLALRFFKIEISQFLAWIPHSVLRFCSISCIKVQGRF